MRTTRVVALLLVLAAACQRKTNSKNAGPPRAVAVTAAPATTKDIPVRLQAIGAVKPFASVSIRSMVAGQLARVAFKEGDEVKEGDLVFEIDPRPFAAAVQQAKAFLQRDQAQLVKAEADFRRATELLKDKFASEASFDQARAAVDAAKATVAADEAALHTAELQLGYCQIRSPVRGRAGTVLVNAGNLIKDGDGSVLAVINQTRPVYVDFSVPEQTLAQVRRQLTNGKITVAVTPPGATEPPATGELVLVNNTVDTSTGTVLLRAVLANEAEQLWPGQFVNVIATLSVRTGAVVVPTAAVQTGQQGTYVFVVRADQSVEMRAVVTGTEADEQTVIESGLQPGEVVVTSNHLRLSPGAKVQLKGADAKPAR